MPVISRSFVHSERSDDHASGIRVVPRDLEPVESGNVAGLGKFSVQTGRTPFSGLKRLNRQAMCLLHVEVACAAKGRHRTVQHHHERREHAAVQAKLPPGYGHLSLAATESTTLTMSEA